MIFNIIMDATALKAMTYDELIEANHNISVELLLRSRQSLTTSIAATNNGHFLPASDQWTHPPFFQPPPTTTAVAAVIKVPSLQRIVKVHDICGPNTPFTLNGVKTWTVLRADIIKILGRDSASYRTYVNVKRRYVKLYFKDTVESSTAYNILRRKFVSVTFVSDAEDKKEEESNYDEEHST